MSRFDKEDSTWVVTVGPRGSAATIKVGRVSGLRGERRHVDIAFSFPDSRVLRGHRWSRMSRTQARVLARVIQESAK